MLDKKSISKGILDEIADLSLRDSHSVMPYFAEKFAELHVLFNQNELELESIKTQLENSELFFSLPEIILMTRNKLPHVLIKAGDIVPAGHNLYEPEAFRADEYFRWTGPERLNNFNVPIDRSTNRIMRLRIVAGVKTEVISSLKIYVDGALIAYEIDARDGLYELIATLPAVERVQDTLISLFVPYLLAASEVDNRSSDTRKLGVAFYELEVM